MVFCGGGALLIPGKARDIKPVAAADRKRKELKVAHLACLTLVKKSGRGKRRRWTYSCFV